MKNLLALPPDWSTHGHEIDALIVVVHWIMLALFVGWGLYFIVALIRFRGGRNRQADYTGAKGTMAKYVEGGVVIAEIVLLVGFAFPIWAKLVHEVPSEAEATVVRVVAQQFAWNFHYPGPDGVFGPTDPHLVGPPNPIGLKRDDPTAQDDIVTINQLHLPVGRPIILQLSSMDVIHSLNLPVLRIKQDIIPGMTIPVWFEATQTGKSDVACAQLCGMNHYRMQGFVTVETQEEFEAWLAEQAELSG